MELAYAPREEAQFDNVSTSRDGSYARTGSKAARVNKDKVLGPWKTIKVNKGDKIRATAYGYYETTGSTGTRTGLYVFLNAFGSNYPAPSESSGNDYPKLQAGVGVNVGQPTPADGVPVAYLKVLFYDKGYNFVSSQIRQITATASSSWEELLLNLQAEQEGYVQVLVANESEKQVWFDDIEIAHTPALIVQEQHYEPFGMEVVGIGKRGQPHDKRTYNGKEKQEELELGWLDYGWRNYDSQLGRWHSVDPMTETQESWTPYHYVYNNPVKLTDPDGRCPDGDCPPSGVTGADVANGLATDILSVKHSVYNAVLSLVGSDYRATFVENEAGNYETGFVKTNLTPAQDAVGFALDVVSVASFGKGGGPTGGLLAKTQGGASTTNAVKSAVNKNTNNATSKFGLYKIKVDGALHKIGKADLNRITKSSGLPTRTHQQVRKLQAANPSSKVTGKVVKDLGKTTTEKAKEAETKALQDLYDKTGTVPPGNQKSFKPK